MSDYAESDYTEATDEVATDEVAESEVTEVAEGDATPDADAPEAEKRHKSSPTFGLKLVGDALPDTQTNRGGGGRGPDMRIHGLLTELAEADPRNPETGEPQWAMLAQYTTGNGAQKVITSIEEGERPVPEGIEFEFAERRWSEQDAETGKARRVSGLFAKIKTEV